MAEQLASRSPAITDEDNPVKDQQEFEPYAGGADAPAGKAIFPGKGAATPVQGTAN